MRRVLAISGYVLVTALMGTLLVAGLSLFQEESYQLGDWVLGVLFGSAFGIWAYSLIAEE